jgi:hypothetical protein
MPLHHRHPEGAVLGRSRRPLLALILAPALSVVLATSALAATIPVVFTSLPVAHPDSLTHASIKTRANARCTIRVRYATGYSHAQGLEPKTAPASGRITWEWEVGKSTTPGKWPVTVTCKKGTATGTVTKKLVVEP